jgi:hypothetical protein
MKIVHGAALLFAALASTALYLAWSEARADRAKLEVALTAQQQVIAQAQQRENAGGQALAATLSQIASVTKAAQTPEEILRALPQYLPLPAPLEPVPTDSRTIVISSAAAGKESKKAKSARGAKDAPNATSGETATTSASSRDAETSDQTRVPAGPASGGVLLPSADLKPLFDYVQDCRGCDARLTAAQQDLADERTKEQALQRERDAAVTNAKGGSVWTHLKRSAKWFGIGALAGAAAVVAAHH